MIDFVERLRSLDASSQRAELAAAAPRGAEAANWWLKVIWVPTLRIESDDHGDRREQAAMEWLRVATVILESADEAGAWNAEEVLRKRAHLALIAARNSLAEGVPEILRPDLVAEAALAANDGSPQEAADRAAAWQDLPVPEILKLRRIRQHTRMAEHLVPYLDDQDLVRRVAAWQEISSVLP